MSPCHIEEKIIYDFNKTLTEFGTTMTDSNIFFIGIFFDDAKRRDKNVAVEILSQVCLVRKKKTFQCAY